LGLYLSFLRAVDQPANKQQYRQNFHASKLLIFKFNKTIPKNIQKLPSNSVLHQVRVLKTKFFNTALSEAFLINKIPA
jgi:hypothetical protein